MIFTICSYSKMFCRKMGVLVLACCRRYTLLHFHDTVTCHCYSILIMTKQKKSRLNELGDYVVLDRDKSERSHYTILQKIACVEYAQLCIEEDLASMNTVMDEIGVSNLSLSRWINKYPLVLGCQSQLEDIGPELLAFVEDLPWLIWKLNWFLHYMINDGTNAL